MGSFKIWHTVQGKCTTRSVSIMLLIWVIVGLSYLSVDKCHSHAYHVIYHMQPVHIFCLLRVSRCPKVVKIMCLKHDMLQSVVVSGVVIYHISNVNGVLQYTRITALCNTSVIFLAVQNNNLQGQICLRLSSRNRFQLS